MLSKNRLLYFVTEDWYFCSHRLPLAIAAKAEGYDVTVVTRVNQHAAIIRSHGLNLISIDLSRRSKNPLRELGVIWRLFKIYREQEPDIVHHVAFKPVIYGTLVARLLGVSGVVNALAGLGFLFAPDQKKAKFMRLVIENVLKFLLNHSNGRVILQNPDDRSLLVSKGVVSSDAAVLIRGSGINPLEFKYTQEPIGRVVVMLASRMLWDKGVKEFVDAAREIKLQGVDACFVLVGEGDSENPASIPNSQLESWQKEGVVEWWGRQNEMQNILCKAHIICLPSAYGEGVPKVLIEAAACGRPIVTTDTPGCREIVKDGHNGLLVPVKNVTALKSALLKLIEDPSVRKLMGLRGRAIAEGEFSIEIVIQRTLAIYADLLR